MRHGALAWVCVLAMATAGYGATANSAPAGKGAATAPKTQPASNAAPGKGAAGQQQTTPTPSASYLIDVIDLAPKAVEKPACVTLAPVTGANGRPAGVWFVGDKFTFTARAANGLAIGLVKENGQAITPADEAYSFELSKPGTATITAEATGSAKALGACSSPSKLTVEVLDAACGSLRPLLSPAGAGGGPAAVDASSVIPLLGNPDPLSLQASGSKILVYSSTLNAKKNQPAEAALKNAIKAITPLIKPAQPQSQGLQMDLAVPRGKDAASLSFTGLGYSQFDISEVSPGSVHIAEKKSAACGVWLAMLRDVRRKAAGVGDESPVGRIFYVQSAADAAAAITGASATRAQGQAPSTNSGGGGTPGSASPGATPATPTAAGAQKANAQTATGQKPASGPTSSSPDTGDSSQTAPAAPANSNPPPAPDATVKSLEQDMLIFNGDEGAIAEKKRILAMLDLPRPEMIINAWVLQASTSNKEELGQFDQIVRRFVSQSNDELQQGIGRGWESVRREIAKGNFFDEEFYRYLAFRFIGEPRGADAPSAANDPNETSRNEKGICPRGEYCLGYTSLFYPLKPRLTDLLLATIAAKDPSAIMSAAILQAEGRHSQCPDSDGTCKDLRKVLGLDDAGCGKGSCGGAKSGASQSPQWLSATAGSESEAGADLEDLGRFQAACGRRDLEQLVNSAGPDALKGAPPQLQLECFRATIERLFGPPPAGEKPPTPAQALARAALADFLFHYKMSQQYPHDFSAYALTQSADALNTALTPFIDAFNRDISAFQEYLNAVVKLSLERQPHRGTTFTNSGFVTVRTVSGNPTEVSSTSQSSLDVSDAPDLATLAGNILNAQPGGGTSNLNATNLPGILGNLSFNEAQVIMGALKSFQTTQAQIGRLIDIKVTPRALSGASSSEMDVKLNADELGTPSKYTGTASQNFNFSRVATHDTTTHVRVDSLRMFEVSSIGTQLTLSRPPFPLILPGVELPYIGSLVGIPRKPAEEFHSSVAIMSAIVVPTAADLAYGLAFVGDRILDPSGAVCTKPWEEGKAPYCETGRAKSPDELEGSITAYHRVRKLCFATGDQFGYPPAPAAGNSSNPGTTQSETCTKLKFSTIVREF